MSWTHCIVLRKWIALGVALGLAVAEQGMALTLRDAEREAAAHSPLLDRASASLDEASWKATGALAGFLPKLSFSADHLFANKFQVLNVSFGPAPAQFPLVQPYTIFSLRASETLFDGLRTPRLHAAAQAARGAAELELSRARFELVRTVRTKFYQALAAQRLLSVADQNIRTLEEHLKTASATVRAGTATRFDVLRIEVQLDEARTDKLQAEDNAELSRHALSVAMGLERDQRPLEGTLPIPDDRLLPAKLELELSRREDIQSRLKAVEASESLAQAGNGAWFPQVSLFAQGDYYNNVTRSLSDPDSYRTAYSLGISLTWNLFDGLASVAEERELVARRRGAEATARLAVLSAPEELDRSRRRFLYNVAVYLARQAAIEKAEESVRLANLSFRAGTRSSGETLDAELDLFRARAGAIRAQVEALTALNELELAAGRPLDAVR